MAFMGHTYLPESSVQPYHLGVSIICLLLCPENKGGSLEAQDSCFCTGSLALGLVRSLSKHGIHPSTPRRRATYNHEQSMLHMCANS